MTYAPLYGALSHHRPKQQGQLVMDRDLQTVSQKNSFLTKGEVKSRYEQSRGIKDQNKIYSICLSKFSPECMVRLSLLACHFSHIYSETYTTSQARSTSCDQDTINSLCTGANVPAVPSARTAVAASEHVFLDPQFLQRGLCSSQLASLTWPDFDSLILASSSSLISYYFS